MGTLRFLHPFFRQAASGVLSAGVVVSFGSQQAERTFYALEVALLCSSLSVISEFLISTKIQKFKGDYENEKHIYTDRF